MSTPSGVRPEHTAPDLSGFLIAHAGMRQEFGLLATVAAEPLEPARAALVEDQIATPLTRCPSGRRRWPSCTSCSPPTSTARRPPRSR
jgi:hypothetical protein